MEMNYRAENRQLTISLAGELDHHAARGLMESIDRCIEQNLPVKTILDMGGLTFMDSSGIGLIMGRHRSMESIGGEGIVRNPPQHIRRVMRLSGMERIARIQMDAPAAQPEEPAERRDEQ